MITLIVDHRRRASPIELVPVAAGPGAACSRGLRADARASCRNPEHALHRHRHPRRDRDAAQPLPALAHRADARQSRRPTRASARRSASPPSTRRSRSTSALFVNAAILILAAATFHGTGTSDVAEIAGRPPAAGAAARHGAGHARSSPSRCSASGQNSTITGTLAGQIVMEGFLNLRLPPVAAPADHARCSPSSRRSSSRSRLRRARAPGELLVLSQVVLSLQLPFAVVPLVTFTSDRQRWAASAPRWVRWLAWPVAVVIAGAERLAAAPGRGGGCRPVGGVRRRTMYKRILVAVEHSAADRTIVDHIQPLARRCDARRSCSTSPTAGRPAHTTNSSCASRRKSRRTAPTSSGPPGPRSLGLRRRGAARHGRPGRPKWSARRGGARRPGRHGHSRAPVREGHPPRRDGRQGPHELKVPVHRRQGAGELG